jgi:DNA-directed RNA polymerase subunit E'/Rpb7
MSSKNNIINETINKEIQSPYINTTLACPVMLYPNQMDNKIYSHLKTNLSNKLLGKCFKNYGFISKIYQITEKSEGIIDNEDPICSFKIIVKFNCRLCIPSKQKEIICKIDRMNKQLISAINGPIIVILTLDRINEDNFYLDINRNIRIKKNSEVLVPDLYVRVKTLSFQFSDHDNNILVIGYLQDIANSAEIDYYKNELTNLDEDN